ncbi:uncharacterized protein [Littorina saxatilis]|uniref:uncharacterized protein isoform X2 n=1 Tax=Littorina saxatilis TaxID=31220 RepID=UPI0038B5B71A
MASKLRSMLSKSDEDLEWSKKGLQKLKDEVKALGSKVRNDAHEPPRILFLGETGSGKSSFISSIVSALKGKIIYTAAVGYHEGQEVNNTRRISEDNGSFDWQTIESRTPKPPSCVVFVQRAQGLGDRDPEVAKKINMVTDLIKDDNINSCVVLTHIDMVKKNLEKSLHLATTCKESRERVTTAARMMGVNENRVFVVKNYVNEKKTHTRHDILILRAVRAILLDVDQRLDDSTVHRKEDQPDPFPPRDHHPRRLSNSTDSALGADHSLSFASSGEPLETSSIDTSNPPVPQSFKRNIAQGPRDTQSGERKSQRRSQKMVQLTQPKKVHEPGLQQSTERSRSTSTLGSKRSRQHDYYIKSSSTSSQEDSHSDEDDWARKGDDDGIDDSPMSDLSSMQDLLNSFARLPYPDKYQEKANLRGAKALNRKTVFQLEHSDITTSDEAPGLTIQLKKEFLAESVYQNILSDLNSWSQADTGAIWLSDTLHNDLGVPLEQPTPDSVDFQVLFLASGFPAFLLTVFDPERVLQDRDIDDEEESRTLIEVESKEVEIFCMHMGKLLTSAMLNFCCCDFILVPCTMRFKDFAPSALTKKLEEEVKATRQYFRGPRVLKEPVYDQLKAAVTAVAGASYVPRLLENNGSSEVVQDTMILMDCDWRGVVSLLIEKLTRVESQEKPEHVTYPDGSWLKMATAVMEAARRLGYAEGVVVVTEEEALIQSYKALKGKVMEDTGLSLSVSVVRPGPDVNTSSASYVIIMDLPDYTPDMNTVVLHVVCDKSPASYV